MPLFAFRLPAYLYITGEFQLFRLQLPIDNCICFESHYRYHLRTAPLSFEFHYITTFDNCICFESHYLYNMTTAYVSSPNNCVIRQLHLFRVFLRYAHVLNVCNFVIFLVVIYCPRFTSVYKCKPHICFHNLYSCFHTYCRAVIVFNVELNVLLQFQLFFTIS